MQDKVGIEFGLVSDQQLKLADQFGLRHPGGNPAGGDIARSATVLVSRDGGVLWSHYTDNYRLRPRPNDILEATKAAMGR